MENTDCRELLEVHRNVIDVESIAFLMILFAPEVSFVTLHMRWHKGCFPKASTKNNSYLKVSPKHSMASRVREQIHNSKITTLSQFNNWTTCSGFLSAYRSQYHTQEGEVALQSGWSFKHRISMTNRMLLYFSLLLCIKTTCAASGLPSYWKFLFHPKCAVKGYVSRLRRRNLKTQ